MDEPTLRYYERRAPELASSFASVASPLRRRYAEAFPPGARVVDVGAGNGRETAALLEDGYDAWGIEPVAAFRELAREHYPLTAGRLVPGALPDALSTLADLGGAFDGAVCCAVLQHVPPGELAASLAAIRALLAGRGRLLVSIPVGRPGIDPATRRDAGGRLFTGVTADELAAHLAPLGLSTMGHWHTPDEHGRPGHTWATLLFAPR